MNFYGGYPVQSESGVDLTLLRQNLQLTPTERWEQNFQSLRAIETIRETMRARRAQDSSSSDRPEDGLIAAKKAAGRRKDELHLLELLELKKLRESPE